MEKNSTNRQPVVKVSQVGVIGRQIGASAVLAGQDERGSSAKQAARCSQVISLSTGDI